MPRALRNRGPIGVPACLRGGQQAAAHAPPVALPVSPVLVGDRRGPSMRAADGSQQAQLLMGEEPAEELVSPGHAFQELPGAGDCPQSKRSSSPSGSSRHRTMTRRSDARGAMRRYPHCVTYGPPAARPGEARTPMIAFVRTVLWRAFRLLWHGLITTRWSTTSG